MSQKSLELITELLFEELRRAERNLADCVWEFEDFDSAQMQQVHLQGPHTCQGLLDQWRTHIAEIRNAVKEWDDLIRRMPL